MQLAVKLCGEGPDITVEAEAPRSLRESMITTVLAAIHGSATVKGVPLRSGCMRELINGLRILGYRVEELSADTVEVTDIEAPKKGVFEVRCGLLTLSLILPLAAVRLDYGEQLAIRASYPELLRAPIKLFIEAVHVLGAKAWHGESMARLMVVEGTRRPSRRVLFGRTYKPWGPLLAGAILASYAAKTPLRLSLHGVLRGKKWLEVVEKKLYGVAQVRYDQGTVTLAVTDKDTAGSPVAGFETRIPGCEVASLLAALPALACNRRMWRIEIKGVSKEAIESNELSSLMPSMGYDSSIACSEKECKILIKGGKPRSLVHDITEDPEYAYLALAHAALSNSAVAGISILEYEGYPLSILANSRLTEEASFTDDTIVFNYSDEKQLATFECRHSNRPLCSIAYGYMLRFGGTIKAVEALDDRIPGLLDLLVEIADFIEVY